MAKFYPYGSPAPAVLPNYLIVTSKGAWAYDDSDTARVKARELRAAGVACKIVVANPLPQRRLDRTGA